MARYKIKADNTDQFRRIRDLAEGRTSVFVPSERRLYIGTDDLPSDLRRGLLQAGVRITEERSHQLEQTGRVDPPLHFR